MRNKLIILTFATLLSLASFAQDRTGQNNDTRISLYPNPAVEFVIIQIEGDASNAEFELNSMIGNKLKIKPEEVGFGKFKINVKDLATGYYFLIIKDEERRFKKAFKFLKN